MSTPKRTGRYTAVTLNAVKHGILSRQAVLPHENREEFDALLAALVEDHAPRGATEQHLVDELAVILWRKRRVLMAENATINRNLRFLVHHDADKAIPAAVPFGYGLSAQGCDLRDLMTRSDEETEDYRRDIQRDIKTSTKAIKLLRTGGDDAYPQARLALTNDTCDMFDGHIEAGEYTADSDGLLLYLEAMESINWRMLAEAQHTPDIRAQVTGEGLQAHKLENLSRYETHLDRKLERTLAMLLKLKELHQTVSQN